MTREFLGSATLADENATEALGERLGAILHAGDVVVLTGPLGAGKTTLARGIGETLHVRGPITSPTFVIARTHPSLVDGPALIHADAYRLHDARELDDLDLDLASSVTVIEWGADAVGAIAEHWIEIALERPLGGSATGGPGAGTEHTDATAGGAGAPDADLSAPEPRIARLRVIGDRFDDRILALRRILV